MTALRMSYAIPTLQRFEAGMFMFEHYVVTVVRTEDREILGFNTLVLHRTNVRSRGHQTVAEVKAFESTVDREWFTTRYMR